MNTFTWPIESTNRTEYVKDAVVEVKRAQGTMRPMGIVFRVRARVQAEWPMWQLYSEADSDRWRSAAYVPIPSTVEMFSPWELPTELYRPFLLRAFEGAEASSFSRQFMSKNEFVLLNPDQLAVKLDEAMSQLSGVTMPTMHRAKSPRRKSKQLGAVQYSEEYEDAHERLLEFAEESQQHFEMGHCLLAGETIDKAYIEYGKMLALSTEVQQVAFNKQALAAIKLVDRPFEAKCVRKKPSEE